MCLTIPKKVLSISGGIISIAKPDGSQEQLKSIIPVEIGDYVFSQQGIIIQKLDPADAAEVLDLFQNEGGNFYGKQ